ncbi:hypothetical protein EV44_g0600 [Erysiphe necator]|uniref:Uncharacterized protein n=1 Tax=Uncinula necator TaxID=52586 RepID=A0A0B1NZP9_UNCNE|nr:hypothetical protein EV44_g0600 [Erysiphe necator]
MHIFNLSIMISLAILLAFVRADLPDEAKPGDAFGPTNYGYKCAEKVYKKYEIYSAAKRLCDVMKKRPLVEYEKTFEVNLYRQPWTELYDYKLFPLPGPPHIMQPILKDGSIYPIDLLPHLRVNKNSNGHWVRIDPGPDRLVINTQCDIIGAFSDYEYNFDTKGGRIEACTLIRSCDDAFGSPSVETPP